MLSPLKLDNWALKNVIHLNSGSWGLHDLAGKRWEYSCYLVPSQAGSTIWSFSSSACFFASYISTEVLCMISRMSLSRLILLNGRRSTTNLRNRGSQFYEGRRYICKSCSLSSTGLRHRNMLLTHNGYRTTNVTIRTSIVWQPCCRDGRLNRQSRNLVNTRDRVGQLIRQAARVIHSSVCVKLGGLRQISRRQWNAYVLWTFLWCWSESTPELRGYEPRLLLCRTKCDTLWVTIEHRN
jgi:hypothetical protein